MDGYKMKESIIQQQIISYLSIVASKEPIIYFSITNETMMLTIDIMCKIFQIDQKKNDDKIRKVAHTILTHLRKMGFVSGVPDLFLGYKSESYYLEVKTKTGRVSAKQQLIDKALERCGFTVYVVRSVEDVESILNDVLEV